MLTYVLLSVGSFVAGRYSPAIFEKLSKLIKSE